MATRRNTLRRRPPDLAVSHVLNPHNMMTSNQFFDYLSSRHTTSEMS